MQLSAMQAAHYAATNLPTFPFNQPPFAVNYSNFNSAFQPFLLPSPCQQQISLDFCDNLSKITKSENIVEDENRLESAQK